MFEQILKKRLKLFNNKVILITGGTGSFGKDALKFYLKIINHKK